MEVQVTKEGHHFGHQDLLGLEFFLFISIGLDKLKLFSVKL